MWVDKDSFCGARRVWETDKNDPFYGACTFHDAAYLKGETSGFTRKETDKMFLTLMLAHANTPLLKARAYLYYSLVRLVGGNFWEDFDRTPEA